METVLIDTLFRFVLVLFHTELHKKGGERMPRQSRITSYSGYSHVIVRGIGKQILFEEKEDYYFYLSRMKKYSQELNVTIIY